MSNPTEPSQDSSSSGNSTKELDEAFQKAWAKTSFYSVRCSEARELFNAGIDYAQKTKALQETEINSEFWKEYQIYKGHKNGGWGRSTCEYFYNLGVRYAEFRHGIKKDGPASINMPSSDTKQ
jgi:hypothetical protein